MTPPAPIALVLFDAFDTLVTPRIPPHAQYAEEARRAGLGACLCGDTSGRGSSSSSSSSKQGGSSEGTEDPERGSIQGGAQARGTPAAGHEDAVVKAAFKASFKALAKQHPLYGLHTGLATSDEWWTMLIESTMLRSGVPASALASQMATLAPSLLRRFASERAYRLADGAEATLRGLRGLADSMHAGDTGVPLAMSLATNSDERILEACKALNLGRYLALDVVYDEARPPTQVEEKEEEEDGGSAASGRGMRKKRTAVSGPTLSYDVGFEKPDTRFFHSAVARSFPRGAAAVSSSSSTAITSLSLEDMCRRTLYVGDTFDEDYVGATRAGLQAVWLQRTEPQRGDDDGGGGGHKENVLAVRDMRDIVGIVKQSWEA